MPRVVKILMRTSKAGKWNRAAFTLLELIVVLAVMGSVLFITLPKFSALLPGKSGAGGINLLVNTINGLKKKSVVEGVNYVLNLNPTKSTLWVTQQDMTPEMLGRARQKAHQLNESITIGDVEFHGISNPIADEYQFRFNREGYCDMALIHLENRNRGEKITIVIQPFLSSAEVRRGYLSFDPCM